MKQLMAAVLAGASVESETVDSSLGSSRFEKKKREKKVPSRFERFWLSFVLA